MAEAAAGFVCASDIQVLAGNLVDARLTYSFTRRQSVGLRTFFKDLINCWILIPLLLSVILALVLIVCGLDWRVVGVTVLFAIPFALAGQGVCSSSITVWGSTAASAVIVLTFGTAYGLLISTTGIDSIATGLQSRQMYELIIGGLPSISKPSPLTVTLSVIGILGTAYLMAANGQPPIRSHPRGWPPLIRIVLATLPGAVIGILLALAKAVSAEPGGVPDAAFALGFAVLGSVTFAAATANRRVEWREPKQGFASVLGIHWSIWITIALVFMGFNVPKARLLAVGIGHSMFHGSMFAASYLVGESMGGRLVGGIACALEGAGGYLGYLASAPWDVHDGPIHFGH